MQRVDHPNVDQFITAKERNPRIDALKQLLWSLPQLSDEQKVYFAGAQDGTVTGVLEDAKTFERFNISIAITDQFMQAVRADEQFDLIFGGQVWKTVRARELWDLILRHTYEENDPGVAFIDRINELNNLWYCETIYTFNPCGEQPLPPDAVCLLASLNLVQFVLQAFRAGVSFGWVRFREVIRLAVRLLDDVIELSYYPLEDQHQSALQKRRMGLGVTGVGDLFVMMLTRYGSLESVKLFREIMYDFTKTAYHASVDLAIEKGPFPLFDADKYCQSKFLKQAFADHPEDYAELIERIRKHGIRNSHLTSIAPTGTISITANNVSSGIEPIFCKEYDRFVVVEEGRREKIRVMDYAWRLLHELREEGTLTEAEEKEAEPYFVDVESLTVDDHYAILETAARYVDSAVSKTMNIPQGYPFEDFRRFYEQAYDSGVIKGCTTYRSGTGKSVLSRGEVPFPLKQMPEQLPGRSFTCRADGKKWYIHVDSLEGIPVQVFAHTNSKDPIKVSNAVLRVLDKLLQEHSVPVEEIDAQAERAVEKKDQMARWISLALRYGIPAAKVWAAIDEAHPSITTLPWHISHCLKICDPVLGKSTLAESCPECKEKTLIREEGCVQCLTCGYSAC
jgi:ribonucleoside-diphosphate reductase alpha chain